MNDSKSIKILEHLLQEIKEIRTDVNHMKVEQGKISVKLWVVYTIGGFLMMEVFAGIAYIIKQWIEK